MGDDSEAKASKASSDEVRQISFVRGDARSLHIAAASVVAKVTRDEMMVGLDGEYSAYGFAAHKGYGTVFHLDILRKIGPSPVHRKTFKWANPNIQRRLTE